MVKPENNSCSHPHHYIFVVGIDLPFLVQLFRGLSRETLSSSLTDLRKDHNHYCTVYSVY